MKGTPVSTATTAERNAIPNPEVGVEVYNITTNTLDMWTGSAWESIGPGNGGGTVSSGTANQLAYYASTGTTVAGLTTANNGVVITSNTGVPSVSSTLPSGITLVAPALGTPASGVLSNCTNLPISTGVSGLGAGVGTFLATPTSANLRTAVATTSTGTGALVFGTSPTLGTPDIGIPSAGILTNCTGLPVDTGISGLGSGVAAWLAAPTSANLLAAVVTTSTGTGSLTFNTSPTFVTPALGTPASGVLTNCTGLPISTGVSGLGANVGTFLATPSSANLAAALTDETGTGLAVFATSPVLTTPNIGTPSAGVLTNCTGLPISTGVSGLGANVGTFLTTPSSANLAAALTDETGTGSAVFATSPTLVTPALGTPSSGVLTNCTGLPISTGVSGLATNMATFLATSTSANFAAALTDETGSGSVVFSTSPTLVTPALGTPSSGVLTNCTGLPISTGVSGLGTGIATFLATPSSANLAAALTDETGTGAAVFANTPTFVTPLLGTPTSGVLTNCTGLPISTGVSGLGTGVATFLATPSSANLAAALTDETGTGANVFATSPTLVTPTLGAALATSVRLTNAGILDNNGNTILSLSATASAVNNVELVNGPTGQATIVRAVGSDSNIILALLPKGTSGTIIWGTQDASAAGAREIGEVISSVIASGSAVAVTHATATNVTSISLTAGDWDVWGNITGKADTNDQIQQLSYWISLTSATLPDSSLTATLQTSVGGSFGTSQGLCCPPLRVNISSTTTVYLSALMSHVSTGNFTAWGGIYARRRR